jgi:predicted O-linked N-acetylglucosamine transferase (SPINDLY family)
MNVFYEKFYNENLQSYKNFPKNLKDKKEINIGYFTPDLNFNAVSQFLTPLLKHYNKNRFNVFCFQISDTVD